MPVIRIPAVNLRLSNPIRFIDEDGRVRELPHLRLRMSIVVGKVPPADSGTVGRLMPAILDTGAPITVFPKRCWRLFASEVRRMQLADDRPLTNAIAGRRFEYFLGRIWVGAVDLWGRRMPPSPVIAQFREDEIPSKNRNRRPCWACGAAFSKGGP